MNGLIAMALAAKYKKPTIVARLNPQGFDRGSARGLNNSALESFKDFLSQSGYFEYAQGHANAFGISIPDKYLTDFHKYANDELKNIDFGENSYDVNFERDSKENDIGDIITDLCHLEGIFGQNNSEPFIHITNIPFDSCNTRVMGANNDTLKIEYNGVAYMQFHAKDLIEKIQEKGSGIIEIVGRGNLNSWGGRITPQVFIEDYEIK